MQTAAVEVRGPTLACGAAAAPRRVLSAQPTIVIVDDEPDILGPLARVLGLLLPGARVLPFADACVARRFLDKGAVAAVVCDFRMPGVNGPELLVAARESNPAAFLVLMTAYPAVGVSVRAVNEAGVGAIFPKPFDAVRLVEKIEAALRSGGTLGPAQQRTG